MEWVTPLVILLWIACAVLGGFSGVFFGKHVLGPWLERRDLTREIKAYRAEREAARWIWKETP